MGTFILSFDCEGKWGMADHLDESHEQLTDAALLTAYETLLDTLAAHNVHATFAFVMGFVLPRDAFQTFSVQDPWLAPYRKQHREGQIQGWHLPRALEAVRARDGHEIASHGFTHRPIDQLGAEDELAAASKAADLLGISPKTLVYPRNKVGNVDLLHSYGFIGYRTELRRPPGKVGRLFRLAEEFNVRPRSQAPHAPVEDVVPIPSGRFVNWPHGARRMVPGALTAMRVQALISDAARNGGVAHLWLHPHNLVTAPDTMLGLRAALSEVVRQRNEGKIRVMTQEAYCREILASGGQ